MRATFRSAYGFVVSVNTGAGKYLQFLDGVSTKKWSSIVASLSEIANFDAIFDEIFVHSIVLEYRCVNKGSSNASANGATATAAGNPGFVNTLGASIVYLPDNSAAYVDASSTWFAMRAATHSRTRNLGDDWQFTAKNPAKFSWNGPLGDQSSGNATQEWINIGNISSAMGGIFQIATPEPSGAAALIGTLVEGGVFGHMLALVTFSMRARA